LKLNNIKVFEKRVYLEKEFNCFLLKLDNKQFIEAMEFNFMVSVE